VGLRWPAEVSYYLITCKISSVKKKNKENLNKHTSLSHVLLVGLRRPSLVLENGPSLACVGLRWPSLAVVDSWVMVVVVGLLWPALAIVDLRWLLWVFYSLRWPLLACVGRCGSSTACVGLRLCWYRCWPVLAVVGCVGL
jgi:hypothetical protein